MPPRSLAVIPILGNCEPAETSVPLAPVKNAWSKVTASPDDDVPELRLDFCSVLLSNSAV